MVERSVEQGNLREQLAVIVMGSDKDEEYASKVKVALDKFGINSVFEYCSAHKDGPRLAEVINGYNQRENLSKVFVGIAGRQNALALSISGLTQSPVVCMPVFKEESAFAPYEIIADLRQPSGISAPVLLYPEAVALHIAAIFSLSNPELVAKISDFQAKNRDILTNYGKIGTGGPIV